MRAGTRPGPMRGLTLIELLVALALLSLLALLSWRTLDGMTRDPGWRFLSVGRRIERLQWMCATLRLALAGPRDMDLILWRHAEAIDLDLVGDDLLRSLTAKGEKQAARMGAWLDRQLPDGAKIWSSPATRTRCPVGSTAHTSTSE